MVKFLLILVFAALPILSCGGGGQGASATTARVDEFDGEIMRIAENARNTLNIFFRYLSRPEAGEGNFSVKYAFQVGGDAVSVEQVWISNITFNDGMYYGTIVNAPVYLTEVGMGDRVSFNVELITDWMFTRDGRIVGGHSIRHLLERIPEGERTDGQRRTLQMFQQP